MSRNWGKACMFAMMVVGGCTTPPTFRTWFLVEVTDATTSAPVVAKALSVPSIYLEGAPGREPEFPTAQIAPTDQEGRSLIPITTYISSPREFDITIGTDEQAETLTIRAANGAVTSGRLYTVKLVDDDAEAPPVELSVRVGTNPAEIDVNGYIDVVYVCSSSRNAPILSFFAPTFRPQYVESFSIQESPPGFLFDAFDPAATMGNCDELGLGLGVDGVQYRAIAIVGEDESGRRIMSETFCVVEDQGAIPCP